MNKQKRKVLEESLPLLTEAWGIVSNVLNAESISLDNTPVKLQSGEKYDRLEEVVQQLYAALQHIDGAVTCIKEAIE